MNNEYDLFNTGALCPCDEEHFDHLNTREPFESTFHTNANLPIDHHTQYTHERFLHNEASNAGDEEPQGKLWQIIYVSFVLLFMFIALVSDAIGADMVMVSALTLLMAAQIISVQEGMAGFANEGLLTVLVLFVVAAGISHTGALDWYMGKLLGRPKNATSAQLRLMIPIAIISAFLNNTPVVVVMIPIVQRWGKNVGVSPQQLLMPLSFASILGGTCTLIGTSTNLVVVGLLQARYPGDEVANVGLFDLGTYGVPIAFAGMLYVILLSDFLIPGGSKFIGGSSSGDNLTEAPTDIDESILLGARLTKWSAAVNRTVKRSGLHDTAGLYLVNVHRAATGNVHRAVGQDFVLNVGDILYFTGLVEGFGKFCEDNGLEVITNEIEETVHNEIAQSPEETGINELDENNIVSTGELQSNDETSPLFEDSTTNFQRLELGIKNKLSIIPEVDAEIGTTKESLMQSDYAERQRYINRLQDTIRGIPIADPIGVKFAKGASAPPRIVAVSDKEDQQMVLVGVNAHDRPGLLLDLSKTLISMGLNLHRTEAMVIDGRSLSLWRCEVLEEGVSDIEDIWSALNAMLETNSGIEAIKRRGIRVVRAVIPKISCLVGVTATDVNFREKYKCAIIAVQRNGKSPSERLSQTVFAVGDVLVLQASDDSPLLIQPPKDYYKNAGGKGMPRTFSNSSLAKFVRKRFGSHGSLDSMVGATDDGSLDSSKRKKVVLDMKNVDDQKDFAVMGDGNGSGSFMIGSDTNEGVEENQELDEEANTDKNKAMDAAWKDLAVVFPSKSDDEEGDHSEAAPTNREFLTAMEILPKSSLASKTVGELGLNKLPGVFLVSIERPVKREEEEPEVSSFAFLNDTDGIMQRLQGGIKSRTNSNNAEENMSRRQTIDEARQLSISSYRSSMKDSESPMLSIQHDKPLEDGDILWFSGTAAAIGDLRKIPGMKSYVNKEVKKINEKVHDRRLVQAVIARRAKLVGKTIKQIKFRTRFGAAVIAVHREGKRVQEHPGDIKLQAGDVLLLEAGPTFIRQNADNDNSFALLSQVENSSPPRLKLLIPALTLTIAMLVVYTIGIASLLVSGLVASMLMVAFGILSQQEVRDAINWEIYITIASAFGIGTALTNSGVAGGIADGLVSLGQALRIGQAGLFGAVYFATFLISNVVTNNAAAALLFPVAMDAAETTGADRQLMSYILMLGASASFMSPFGYTTNLLIYGPGGYKYVDFLRIGTPMQIVLWILSVVFVVTPASKWYLSWIFTFSGLVVVSLILTMGSSLTKILFSRCNLFKKQLSEEMKQS